MLTLKHDGFVAWLRMEGDLIRGEVQDTREPIIFTGSSVAELKEEFARKIEDYCSLCERHGLNPFVSGTPTAEGEGVWFGDYLADPPPQWPHQKERFFNGKALSLRDEVASFEASKHAAKPGKPKFRRLPIDSIVEQLAERRRAPKLIDDWRTGRPARELPQFIRSMLASAFERVAFADPRNRDFRRDEAFEFLRLGRQLDEAATQLLQRYSVEGLPNFSRGLEDARRSEHFNTAILAERYLGALLERLHMLMGWAHADLDDTIPAYGGKPRLEWKYDFVGAMANLWFMLTGRRPSSKPDGLFIELVDAAWRSGGDDMPSQHWEKTVRSYLARQRKGDPNPTETSDG